jgi:hypothetical protein
MSGMTMFRSQLRSAVREAQLADAPPDPVAAESQRPAAELLRRLARGEITLDEAIRALEPAP